MHKFMAIINIIIIVVELAKCKAIAVPPAGVSGRVPFVTLHYR